jgi:symplekin
MSTAEQQLSQLKQAEILVQQDPSHYPTILPAVLALALQPDTVLRRWIANFLINTFASRTLDSQVKEDLAATALDPIRSILEGGDDAVLKSCILSSSLIYPILFRRMYPFYPNTLTEL